MVGVSAGYLGVRPRDAGLIGDIKDHGREVSGHSLAQSVTILRAPDRGKDPIAVLCKLQRYRSTNPSGGASDQHGALLLGT